MSSRCYKIFVLSDEKKSSASLRAFLNDYDQYQLHFIPTEVNLFEVLKYEPDIVVLDSEVNKVVKCYEWDLAA